MTSYFDDHGLSSDDEGPLQPAPARVAAVRSMLEGFTTSPHAARDAAEGGEGSTPAADADAPPRPDLSGLPEPLRNAIGTFDELRIHAHSAAQSELLGSLIQDLLTAVAGPSGPPPASKAFIATLPRVDPIPPDSVCAICNEALETGDSDARRLPCGHTYDRDCIVPWLELRNTCPMCRHELPTDRPAVPKNPLGGVFPGLGVDSEDEEEDGARARRGQYSSYAGHRDRGHGGAEDSDDDGREYRYLGRSGLRVSALSLGGWITYGGQCGADTTYQCMKAAYDLGINFFDTAEVYAAGQSEVDMGNAIKKLGAKRSDLVISTKIFWGGKGPNSRGLSRKHIIEGLRASLARLQLEYVDVVFAHRPDPNTPMEEIVRAFNHAMDRGWTFYWGTSEWSAQQITEAHAVAARLGLVGPTCEQPQYNMLHREKVEREFLPLFAQYGLGTTVWSPLASGILTGKYLDPANVPADSRFAITGNPLMERMRRNLTTDEGLAKIAKVRQLCTIADKLGATPAQLALAWCLRNPNVSSVITGASRPSQIAENVQALNVVPLLTPEIVAEIEDVLLNKPEAEVNFRDL
ncbi:hypothetical protein H9P43_002193 [Blastocladiella emersonii ATCC 22665]|nr:hypothetical protein H9P43_002193 [Blastocladiella emersonii ATCC 22665]